MIQGMGRLIFNSIVRDEVNRNKFQEDSAILNSLFMDNLV